MKVVSKYTSLWISALMTIGPVNPVWAAHVAAEVKTEGAPNVTVAHANKAHDAAVAVVEHLSDVIAVSETNQPILISKSEPLPTKPPATKPVVITIPATPNHPSLEVSVDNRYVVISQQVKNARTSSSIDLATGVITVTHSTLIPTVDIGGDFPMVSDPWVEVIKPGTPEWSKAMDTHIADLKDGLATLQDMVYCMAGGGCTGPATPEQLAALKKAIKSLESLLPIRPTDPPVPTGGSVLVPGDKTHPALMVTITDKAITINASNDKTRKIQTIDLVTGVITVTYPGQGPIIQKLSLRASSGGVIDPPSGSGQILKPGSAEWIKVMSASIDDLKAGVKRIQSTPWLVSRDKDIALLNAAIDQLTQLLRKNMPIVPVA